MALEERDILEIINQELSNSSYISQNMEELRMSLSYYLGKPDGTEVEGRSQVISTDVADSIEWIMPQVMKSFTQNNEIVVFDPVNEGDEDQAELESEYVYDVLMKRNDGFVIMHQFVKDALMQRNGVIKVYYEDYEEHEVESYTGLTEDQYKAISLMPNVQIISVKESQYDVDGMGTMATQYDVKLDVVETHKKICVDSVPLEQFRVNANHDSIDLSSARFTAHVVQKTKSEVRAMGVSEEIIEQMSDDSLFLSSYRFSLQDENYMQNSFSADDSERLVSVAECTIRMDVEENSISRLYKVTCAGIMNATHILKMEELEDSPWISTTGILMSHKFQGLSIYDRIKQIQEQKTALLRNMLDNIYLTNNQRSGVIEGQVNLDDLLVSRPGGIVRMKKADALFPIQTPQLGDAALNMVNYLDQVRAGRTGVSAEGNASPERIGDRIGSQGLDRMMNAKEELVGLIIRVIVETGIKPLCYKVRDLAVRHMDAVEDFKFRGRWVKINPSEWEKRNTCTVRVGTGTGDRQAQIASIREIVAMQKEIFAQPGQSLVNDQQVFNSLDLYCKLSGLHSAHRFFTDPGSQEGQQAKQLAAQQAQQQAQQQQALQQAQMQLEQKIAEAESIKAQAAIQRNELHAQISSLQLKLKQVEQEDRQRIAQLEQELKQTQLLADANAKSDELKYKENELAINSALKLTEIEAKSQTEQNNNYEQNRQDF